MDLNGISADLLGFYESQLRATLEMTQRLLAQVEARRRALPGRAAPVVSPPVVSPPVAEPQVVAVTGAAKAAVPVPESRPQQEAQFVSRVQGPIDRAREVVPQAVAKTEGIFTLGTIKGIYDPACSDGVINRVLDEMISRGELTCVVRGSGRGGTKYLRPGAALKTGSPLPRNFALHTIFVQVDGIPGSTGLDGTFWWDGPGQTAREGSAEVMKGQGIQMREHDFRKLVSAAGEAKPGPVAEKSRKKAKKGR